MQQWIKPTIKQTLEQTTAVDRLDAELLLAHVLKTSREFLITAHNQELTKKQVFLYEDAIAKRRNGVPVAYITGHKEFYGYDFTVTKDTLVPRPETEHLVERAITLINEHTEGKLLLIDIGTGTGCIPISILKEINHTSRIIKAIATDISKPALRVAKQNAKDHNCDELTFKKGHLLKPVLKIIKKHCCDVLITANLPYVPPEAYLQSPSIQQEPYHALVGDDGGLRLYKELIASLPKEIISKVTLLMEIDPDQTETLRSFILEQHAQAQVSVIQDLAKRDRTVEVHF